MYLGPHSASPADTAQVCKHSTGINSDENIWDETAELIKQTGLKQTSQTTSRRERERETDPNRVLSATGWMSAREHFVSLSKCFHNSKNFLFIPRVKFEFQVPDFQSGVRLFELHTELFLEKQGSTGDSFDKEKGRDLVNTANNNV